MKTSLVTCVLACCLLLIITCNINTRVEAGSKLLVVGEFFHFKGCCKRKGCPIEKGDCFLNEKYGCVCAGLGERIYTY